MPEPQSNLQHETGLAARAPWGAITSLAGLLGLRMLGLFMVLPVLAIYVQEMPGATPLAAGLALGIYGLTQAALQIPFGRLSDRWGRKPVIALGLLIFMLGSALAAVAETPLMLVLGRAVQGAGAISAAVTALVGDLTPSYWRARAMAVVGIAIGTSFLLAFIAGPVLAGVFGVRGLFWVSAGLAALCLGVLALLPVAPLQSVSGRVSWRALGKRIGPEVIGVFLLHALLTASFLVVPDLLVERAKVPLSEHGWIYLPIMLGSLLLMAPLVLLQERTRGRRAMLLASLLLLAGQGAWLASAQPWVIYLGLLLFFGGFNSIEAFLPARVSLLAGQGERGGAMGLFATAQFLGAFTGGALGGLIAARAGSATLIYASVVVTVLWIAGQWWRRDREQIDASERTV